MNLALSPKKMFDIKNNFLEKKIGVVL